MSTNNLVVTVQDTSVVTAATNLNNPVILETLDNVGDVDMVTEGKNNGSILIFRAATQKWTSSTTLDAQNMEGGEF